MILAPLPDWKAVQAQAVARLGQASLTLLAQIDAKGNIQKTFRVNEAGGEKASLGSIFTG